MGIRPGRQAVAFVFGGSRCGFCQRADTKAALALLRGRLESEYGRNHRSITIIGVAVNTDIREGLAYLEGIGLSNFDEISVGSGWRNEFITRLLRREHVAEPAVPLVAVLSRTMTARVNPLVLTYGPDSVMKVLQGHDALIEWTKRGGITGKTETAPALGALAAAPEAPRAPPIGGGATR